MVKKLSVFFILSYAFVCMHISAQSKRRVFHGKIVSDSLSVNKIHIVNKTTQKGTLSNQYGDFSIPVRVNDTLVFSAVQFEIYRRIVSELDIQRLQVIIELKPRINLLDEVVIKPISVAKKLNLPNADKKPKEKLDARLDGHSKASVPIVLLTTIIGGAGGIDNLYYVLSGKRKKDRRLKKLIQEDQLADINAKTAKKIRLHFKDYFFIYTIGIPAEEIDNFIEYCIKDNIIELYNNNQFLEVTEIFFKSRDSFLKEIKD